MPDTFQLQVATPERMFVDEQVSEAQIPGQNGYLGILAGHAPLLGALKPGVLTYNGGSGSGQSIVIDGGFVEVFDNHVHVLTDFAEMAGEVDTNKARQQLDEGNRKLQEAKDTAESEAALRQVEQAQARLDASDHRSS